MKSFKMYSPLRSWKKGELPVSPFVAIAVGAHTSSDGLQFLTPQLMTDTEIDYEIERLISELEQFRTSAKNELRKIRAKMLAK